MTVVGKKYLAAFAATAVLALGLHGCGGGGGGPSTGGDVMMPEPDRQALANVIDLVANDSRQNSAGEYIGAYYSFELRGPMALRRAASRYQRAPPRRPVGNRDRISR